ncbi:MAG: vWA domain-containing protein [Planctomycetota bacterium]|jgi:G:T/U-mismatch repair DNA glycosylase
MKRALVIAILPVLLGISVGAETVPVEEQKPLIQVALLLDTSGSMRGLIDQAKAQLWKVVNEFATAKRDGVHAQLHVALYQYGSGRLPAEDGYMRQVLPLTTDLDKASEELFALQVGGSREYCGQVIQVAAQELHWSDSAGDLKVLFIAGNEPFTQGGVDYRTACKGAISKGITVNTIFCGPFEEGVRTDWKNGAVLADGDYMNIDQNSAVVSIRAPQDEEIARLGAELNGTYIPYGERGREGSANQARQDANAAGLVQAGAAVQRAVSKSSAQYTNAFWDLVDAVEQGQVKLADVDAKDLPEGMREMTVEEREAHVQAKAVERKSIREKIGKLNEERKAFVAEEMKKAAETGENTLDTAIIKALARQAEEKSYELGGK